MEQSDPARPGLGSAASGVTRHHISMTVNGSSCEIDVEAWVTLLDLLRDRFALAGTKKGCDQGQCGACTVLVDGERTLSCLSLAVQRDGADITTVEGLADGDILHPLQQAFMDQDAFQCGYCTPGQLCSAVGLIGEGHTHDRAQVRELMSGNLCRCGAYSQIVAAVSSVLGLPEEDAATAPEAPVTVGTVPA